ncbi:hypothetical protein ACFX19_013259 [Malus domestica]
MVLVDASTHWSHVCLLSTRNVAFSKLLAQVIKLKAHHPDYPIKSIRLDNAGEFTSKTFDDYCMSVGVEVEHPVPHVHTQNDMFIKRLQMIVRSLVIRIKLPIAAWGHAILHTAKLRMMGTYVGYDSLSIIRYLEPLTGDQFTTHFVNCHFYETVFLSLRGDKNVNVPEERCKLLWTTPVLSHLDPCTA